MAKTRNVLQILEPVTGRSRALRRRIDHETVNSRVARMIYDARTAAGLTQQQLAERIGTKQPVIARLEAADYPGHSLSMLQRIATALALQLEVRMIPRRNRRTTRAA